MTQDNQSPSPNTAGIIGFVLSLCGIITCGALFPVGAIVSCFGLAGRPKGFAIAGLSIGGIGTLAIGGCMAVSGYTAAYAPELKAASVELEDGTMWYGVSPGSSEKAWRVRANASNSYPLAMEAVQVEVHDVNVVDPDASLIGEAIIVFSPPLPKGESNVGSGSMSQIEQADLKKSSARIPVRLEPLRGYSVGDLE